MVSFSCENCGDVLTKKKLDQHYNRCYGQFTCIDCMTTFPGTSYRSHTSCMTEDQKYQGALYKEKPSKTKKTVNIIEPHETVPRPAYVEDALDQDDVGASNAIALVKAPPAAPEPPTPTTDTTVAKVAPKPNVFDFLVNDDTPNASRVNLAEPMQMVAHAPPVFRSHSNSPPSTAEGEMDRRHKGERNGYSYGEGPVPASKAVDLYRTPAPKDSRRRRESPSRYAPEVVPALVRSSTDKKRKRQVEELDLSQAQQYHDAAAAMEVDDPNFVPAPLQHSGLTGGLSRMLAKSGRKEYPPSPAYSLSGHDDKENDSEYSDVEETPLHPVKTRRDRERKARGDRDKDKDREGRRGRPSASNALIGAAGALVKVRRSRRTSDESRPRKHHRSHRHRSDEHPDRERHRRTSGDSEARRRKPKAIEWKDESGDEDYEDVDDSGNGQMVLYKDGEKRLSSTREESTSGRSKAERFFSYVKKGPESEKGCSINKALKRYHRDRLADFDGKREERDRDRIEDEKDLWKCLRLRRNDRGEMVVFILEGDE